jgi:iron complex outermembrane receptor protein
MKIRTGYEFRRGTSNSGSVAAAVAAVLAGSSGVARAQDAKANDEVVEEILVTGIRHSIEASIATKREATSVVEVVSAEDIGKLPDTSIADSIARLPGVTAQRIEGRPAAISIRGLSEDYAGALLNGRQVVSSSEGRSAEYDQFPSELVSQVLVYKTVDAAVIGQGLSGTIDIRPLMPLSLNQRQIALSIRGEKNTNGGLSSTGKGEYGNRFSASYVDQFADDTIGVALGFAHLDSPGQAKKFGSWTIGDYNGQWGSNATGVPLADGSGDCLVGDDRPTGPAPDFAFIPQDCALFPQGFESSVTSSKQVRDGAMGVVQFKPSDRFSSVVDLYYSKFEQDRTGHHWTGDIGLWNGGDPPPADFTNVQTGELNGNTIIESATIDGAHSLVYDKNWDRTDTIKSIGWRNELNFTDQWKGTLDLGYSRADRDETYIQSVARANAFSSFAFTTGDSSLAWSTPQDLTDPALVQLTNDPNYAEMRTPKFKDEIKSAQLAVNRSLEWGWLSALDVGVAYNQRDKDVSSDAFRLELTGPTVDPVTGLPLHVIPTEALRDPVMIDIGGNKQGVVTWDVPSIMGLYAQVPKDPWLAQTNKFQVHEKVTTGFLRFNLDTELGPVPMRGNLGVQYVRSEQNSDGFAWNDGAGTPPGGAVLPVSGGADYSDVLPSLNLVFNLKEDLLLRFALGKTLARPRMDDMRAGADQPQLVPNTGSTTEGHWSAGGGGKPDLKPWRAKAVDLSLEKYFQKRSYVAVAGFLKKLDSFIYQRTTERDFTGFINYNPDLTLACPVAQPDCNPNVGEITTQDNGSGGKVYGVELSISLDGGLLTDALEGFGVQLSGSKTYNSLPKDENGDEINLDGFSDNVNSIEAYFERSGFSARVSRRYRSAFTATTRSVILNTQRSTQIDAESQIDAQLGYDFNSGTLEGLTLLLQGNNLTNEVSITRQSSEIGGSPAGLLPWQDDNYGRVIMLGASYKF